jgi:aspartyl-tRNA(Asn)/glutamyl-tRNA(Gln) amidotransferase subunit A
VAGLRVAWSPDLGFAAVDPAVRELAERAARRFEELGAHVEEAGPGLPDPWDIEDTIWSAAQATMHVDDFERIRDQIDPGRIPIIEHGLTLRATDLARAHARRNDYAEAVRAFMQRYDLLLTPTLPITAFPVGADQPGAVNGVPTSYLSWTAFTYPFNLTGQPAASCPCGFIDGLPVGLQIVGRWRDDATVLRAAAAFEELAPWAGARPRE